MIQNNHAIQLTGESTELNWQVKFSSSFPGEI